MYKDHLKGSNLSLDSYFYSALSLHYELQYHYNVQV